MRAAIARRLNLLSNAHLTVLAMLAVLVTRPFMTPYMSLAAVSYFVLAMGYRLRKTDRKVHGMLMALGVFGDLTLVLVLEVQRHAIKTATNFSLTPLQQSHVICSTAATLLYMPLIVMGVLMAINPKNRSKIGSSHRKLGTAAFFFRTLGFILMFSMLKNGHGG